MRKENYTKIKKHLESKLKEKPAEEIASFCAKNLIAYLAVYFAVVTGCRPSEAAHIVYHKKIVKNELSTNKRWGPIDYMATMQS